MRHARALLVVICIGCGSHSSGGGDDAAVIDASVTADASPDSSPCPASQKLCTQLCVPEDPAHGCASASCTPCGGGANATPACAAGACALQCDVGFGDCDGDESNGCEKDVTADPNNCGSCGFMCANGATCVSGACQLVAPGTGSDNACLTIDASTVYWTTANATPGAVYSIAKTGGTVTTIISGQASPRGIAVDATSVYFTTLNAAGKILKCPLAGCNGTPTTLAQNQANPFGLTVDGNNVYWTNRGNGTVMQCAKNGCSLTPTMVASTQMTPTEIAVDAAHVYWTNAGDGTVMQADIGGGNVKPVDSSGMAGAHGIAVDLTAVYYTQSTIGSVTAVPFAGTKYDVATGQAHAWGLAIDATDAYWADSQSVANGGGIKKAPLAGGGPTVTRATNQAFPLCVAVDATTIYWIDAGGNAVQKVAK
jgi:hypothetical protein